MSKGSLSGPSFLFRNHMDASERQGATRPGGTRQDPQSRFITVKQRMLYAILKINFIELHFGRLALGNVI